MWHPGIVAKWFAMKALARRYGAHAAWVVVDQDDNDPTRVAFPTNDLQRRTLGTEKPARPTGTRPAEVIAPQVPADCAAPVRDGFARLLAAVNAHADAPTLADQYTLAAQDLLGGHAENVTVVKATRLSQTTLFRAFAASFHTSPALVQLYNRAVRKCGGAGGVRLLHTDPQRGDELPLWRLHLSGARLPVYSNDPPTSEHLAPRALLLTALLRIGACNLFIHGTGGGVYDRITDRWLSLVREDARTRSLVGEAVLAPTCVVTATRHLPLDGPDLPAPAEIARAAWRAHHAMHNPGIVDDRSAADRKAALVREVANARGKAARLDAYRALHAFLDQYRAAHAGDIAGVQRAAAQTRVSQRAAVVKFGRDWAFPLYPQSMLGELSEAVARAVGVSS